MGQFDAIGIVKGEKFEPDARMRGILEEAAAVGDAMSRTLMFDEQRGMRVLRGLRMDGMLCVGGYNFETPPPMVTPKGSCHSRRPASRKLHARTTFLYGSTGMTPAMCMRLTGDRVAVPRRRQGRER